MISKESHASTSLGYHYHVGLWNDNASKYTASSILRDLFPEFEGRQLNVSFHKGWNSVCSYLLKEDKAPTVWGEESLDVVKERGRSSEGKRRGPDLVKLLRAKTSWADVLADDDLVKKCLSSYSSVRSTFEDMQAAKKNTYFLDKVEAFTVKTKGKCYTHSELKERYYALWWLAYNLCRPRHLCQKQLLILGSPGTKKTNFVQALGEIIDVYFVPRRAKDFTGANKDHHLWVIDECSGYELDVDTLNMILDGQRVSLDTKYGRVFEKTKNVPIIMLGNSIPYNYNVESFRSRVFEVHFFSDCPPLEASRLAPTLYFLCAQLLLMAQSPVSAGELLAYDLTGAYTAGVKRLMKACLGRPVDSVEILTSLQENRSFRDYMTLPFVAFGSSEDMEFPKSESAYRKKPLHVVLPHVPKYVLSGDDRDREDSVNSGAKEAEAKGDVKEAKEYSDMPNGPKGHDSSKEAGDVDVKEAKEYSDMPNGPKGHDSSKEVKKNDDDPDDFFG